MFTVSDQRAAKQHRMSISRLIESVLLGLLAIMVVWTGYDLFVAARGFDYYAEKPIRLVYVTGFAVWLATCLAFLLSRPRRGNGKGRLQ